MDSLLVTEIFYSLQGESTYQGMPCSFIRLAGCNLRCHWCDTKYSFENGIERQIPDILQEISQYPSRLVEITGGEPLYQKNSVLLMETLLAEGYKVLLETNGTQDLAFVPQAVIKIVDVKCPSSGFAESFLLGNLRYITPKDEIKFVIASREDYLYAVAFLNTHAIPTQIIHFSPVFGRLEPSRLAEWILADGQKVKLSLQLHKILNVK
ncbi:MAG: radical SAM protein [Candidatus Cloacimonadaceae bacterium]